MSFFYTTHFYKFIQICIKQISRFSWLQWYGPLPPPSTSSNAISPLVLLCMHVVFLSEPNLFPGWNCSILSPPPVMADCISSLWSQLKSRLPGRPHPLTPLPKAWVAPAPVFQSSIPSFTALVITCNCFVCWCICCVLLPLHHTVQERCLSSLFLVSAAPLTCLALNRCSVMNRRWKVTELREVNYGGRC